MSPSRHARRVLRPFVNRQLDREDRAPAWSAVEGQRAAHRLGEVLRERESESRALDTRRLDVESIEGDEESLHHVGADAESGVTHRNANHVLDDVGTDDDLSLWAVVLDRVGQQVQDDLSKALLIGAHERVVDLTDLQLDVAFMSLQ